MQTGRLARWQLDLQQYDCTIAYVKRVKDPVADCLSRDIDTQIQLMAMTRLQSRKQKKLKNSHGHLESLKDTIEQLQMRNRDKPGLQELQSLYYSVNWQMEHAKDTTLKDFF